MNQPPDNIYLWQHLDIVPCVHYINLYEVCVTIQARLERPRGLTSKTMIAPAKTLAVSIVTNFNRVG